VALLSDSIVSLHIDFYVTRLPVVTSITQVRRNCNQDLSVIKPARRLSTWGTELAVWDSLFYMPDKMRGSSNLSQK
jgi:hypothetical protein